LKLLREQGLNSSHLQMTEVKDVTRSAGEKRAPLCPELTPLQMHALNARGGRLLSVWEGTLRRRGTNGESKKTG